jgi:hypothetical protein
LSDEGWRAALRASAKQTGFGGSKRRGADLMRIPVGRH